jgi:hypothetical protein
VLKGRYITLQIFHAGALMIRELQVYGTKEAYTYESANEWKADVVSTGTVLGRCSACPQHTVTNYTGSLACEACAAGKTTDGRTGQVQCVCDVDTFPGSNGTCPTCPVSSFKATTTDKYKNRACVTCSSCAANQQVNTECNSTHDVTCRACQPSSWSYAGRTELGPCLCNAGYELQGEICVACPVGKARQAGICSGQFFQQLIHDFSPYKDFTSWKNYAASLGATTIIDTFETRADGRQVFFKLGWQHPHEGGSLQLTLPPDYSHVTVDYGSYGTVFLTINGVIRQQIDSPSAVYSQTYTSPTILRIYEQSAEIRADLKITLRRTCDAYVRHECNASRDVRARHSQLLFSTRTRVLFFKSA